MHVRRKVRLGSDRDGSRTFLAGFAETGAPAARDARSPRPGQRTSEPLIVPATGDEQRVIVRLPTGMEYKEMDVAQTGVLKAKGTIAFDHPQLAGSGRAHRQGTGGDRRPRARRRERPLGRRQEESRREDAGPLSGLSHGMRLTRRAARLSWSGGVSRTCARRRSPRRAP